MSVHPAFDDSGSAFPHDEKDDAGVHYHSHGGMSLRDWFAGQALTGLLASSKDENMTPLDAYAADAYRLADAMLKRRSTP